MPVPDFQSIMLPFLRELKDERERVVREVFSAYPGMTQVGLVENRRVCGG